MMTDDRNRPVEHTTVVTTERSGGGGTLAIVVVILLALLLLFLFRDQIFGAGGDTTVEVPEKIDVSVDNK